MLTRLFGSFALLALPSIQNTAKQAVFLATSREAKYNAKTVVDTFVARLGDMAEAVVAGGLALGFGPGNFALVNLGFIRV